MTSRVWAWAGLAALALAGGCGGDAPPVPVMPVVVEPLSLTLEAEGEVRAREATPLTVPGRQWSARRIQWLHADGEPVRSGDVIARFSAEEGELQVAQALIDLERNRLARLNKAAELDAGEGQLAVDRVDVGLRLGIAQRFAGVDIDVIARNDILDAIDDERFLREREAVLDWRVGQARERGDAELAVIDAQGATHQSNLAMRQEALDALELRAPHDGLLVFTANWSGTKPQPGDQVWAGNELGTLPDTARMEVELRIPQGDAGGLAVGQRLRVHPVGRPEAAVDTTVSWVASSAQVRSRNNPARFLAVRAALPPDLDASAGWFPGQRVRAQVVLLESEAAIAVPSLSLVRENGASQVLVLERGRPVAREVEIGVAGPDRTEILGGLAPGDRVLLVPAAAEAGP